MVYSLYMYVHDLMTLKLDILSAQKASLTWYRVRAGDVTLHFNLNIQTLKKLYVVVENYMKLYSKVSIFLRIFFIYYYSISF